MKKIISFEKEINFPGMIGEISSISLDHSLKFINSNSIKGNFIVSGSYKMMEASTIEEEFSYDIPTDIELTENLDLTTSKISIDNFNYEIINDDILRCKIDVLVEGVEEIILDETDDTELAEKSEKIDESRNSIEILENDERECDGDKKEDKEVEIPVKDDEFSAIEVSNKKEDVIDDSPTDIGSLFASLGSADETFTTYSVYIFRRDDTLEKILTQYKITRDELSEYNDLDHLEIGTKLIIPSSNE